MSKFIKKKEVLVLTVSGEYKPRAHCRIINKKYYKKGAVEVKNSGDVYQVLRKDGKQVWHREETGYIIYDYRQKMYVLKNELKVIVETGIVGFNPETGDPILGSFSQDFNRPATTEVIYKGSTYICIDENLLINSKKFREAISDGKYYERNALPAIKFIEPIHCSRAYKNSLPYDSKGITKTVSELHDKLYHPTYSPQVERHHKALKGLSFGVEFETIKGKLPSVLCDTLGLIPLRDGSIAGLEYVTVPLEGKDGLQTLIDSVKQLKRRTRYDKNCALHIHIGGVPRTEEFFIALYKVLFRIQDDVYDMFPLHKFKNFGIKKKHYTKPLPLGLFCALDNKISAKTINSNFCKVFRFLSMGNSYANYGNSLENVTVHPSDPQGQSKWNIRTRYHWVNLIPLLFGNKQTIEFRIHTPTCDVNKIINYLFLCTSIIEFTKQNTNAIIKDSSVLSNTTLAKLVMSANKGDLELVKELTNYIDYRKEFISRKTGQGDLIADEDEFIYRHRHIDWSNTSVPNKLKRTKNAIWDLEQTMVGNVDPFPVGPPAVEGNFGIQMDENG
tara:strand:+ start:29408 stop:31081 length:1674 start_codon:yes stop_codon:yes gene_type:complete